MVHRVAGAAADRAGRVEQLTSEIVVVGLRHSEQVRDDEHREGVAEVGDEFTAISGERLVVLTIGKAPHELLVLLEAFRRDHLRQQRPVIGVYRRIQARQLIIERQFVAVLGDQFGDVVALEGNGKTRKRPGDRRARREALAVVVDGDGFLVARDHHDAVMGLAAHRALVAYRGQVVIRVVQQPVVSEEVDRVDVGHASVLGWSLRAFRHRRGSVARRRAFHLQVDGENVILLSALNSYTETELTTLLKSPT